MNYSAFVEWALSNLHNNYAQKLINDSTYENSKSYHNYFTLLRSVEKVCYGYCYSFTDYKAPISIKKDKENKNTIATSSTGNAASSLACQAARMGLNISQMYDDKPNFSIALIDEGYGSEYVRIHNLGTDSYYADRQIHSYANMKNKNGTITLEGFTKQPAYPDVI